MNTSNHHPLWPALLLPLLTVLSHATVHQFADNYQTLPAPPTGPGDRLVWSTPDHAFRAGQVSGNQWDPIQLGAFSFAFGRDTVALGDFSFAFGDSASAVGLHSLAVGRWAYADGAFSLSLGDQAFSPGQSALALGPCAWAEGDTSIALGESWTYGLGSVAIGRYSAAAGTAAVALGGGYAESAYSFAVGPGSTAARWRGSPAYEHSHSNAAIGRGVTSRATGALVVGQFNEFSSFPSDPASPSRPLFVVGMGTGYYQRRDAFRVHADGNAYLAGRLFAQAPLEVEGNIFFKGPQRSLQAQGSTASDGAFASFRAGQEGDGGSLRLGSGGGGMSGGDVVVVAGGGTLGGKLRLQTDSAALSGNIEMSTAAGSVGSGSIHLETGEAPYGVAGSITLNPGAGLHGAGTIRLADRRGGVAIGEMASAVGHGSVAAGLGAEAYGGAVALGDGVVAQGLGSLAVGKGSRALGKESVALGRGTVASHAGTTVVGQFNQEEIHLGPDSSRRPLFVVGAGTSPSQRSNALVVRANGDVVIGSAMEIRADGTVILTRPQGDISMGPYGQ